MVRIVTDLGGQIEGDGQSGLSLLQEELVALVRFLAFPNPAYCRIVQCRPLYMVGWTPLVNG